MQFHCFIFFFFFFSDDDKFTIRRATAEDKENVLNIRDNVFGGNDFLPAFYDHFLSSPDIISSVMLYDNHIVSCIVYDKGQKQLYRCRCTAKLYVLYFFASLRKHAYANI